MKDAIVTEGLYAILQNLSGCKYLYDWVLDAAIDSWVSLYGKVITDEQRVQLRQALVDNLPKIGFQQTVK